MLRITARVEPTETVLELQGRLTGSGLRSSKGAGKLAHRESARQGGVKSHQLYRPPRKDASGRDTSTGTALEGAGCMTSAIIEAITAGEKT